jgi:hypothetical protein
VKILVAFAVAFVIIVLAAVAAEWWYFPSASLNYKLSVDVDDNGVMRHGEGVIGVDFQSNGFMLIDNTPQWSIGARGEAFAVDLGERGALFVLLSHDPMRKRSAEAGRAALFWYFGDSFGDLPPNQNGKRQLDEFIGNRAVAEVAPDKLPMLVRFADINDPKSVDRIDPEHLDASFGLGVKLARATAQLTDEPVTIGIENRLSWFRTQAGHLGGQLIEDHIRPERNVTLGAFVEGMKP